MVWIWDPVLQIMESFSEKTLHMTLFMSLPSIYDSRGILNENVLNLSANTRHSITIFKVDGMVGNTV